jgi:PIN domain nuclease of toxin-antitoxin system
LHQPASIGIPSTDEPDGWALAEVLVVVIDTHVLLWWASSATGQLTKTARSWLLRAEKAGGGIVVSAISAWEIAVLAQKGRLTLSMDVEDWLTNAASLPGVRFAPVDRHTAVQSVRLPEPLHQDPADRIIVATARAHNFPLITADAKIQQYKHVKTIWR